MREKFLRPAFWAGVIGVSIVSVLPRDVLEPITFDIWDKLQHVIAYGVLSVLGGMAYPARKNLVAIFFGLVTLGGALELIQTHVPNRQASVGDAVANALGAGLGLILERLAGRVRAGRGD